MILQKPSSQSGSDDNYHIERSAFTKPSLIVWVPALFIASAMLLPILYLVLHISANGPEIFGMLIRGRTFSILTRSIVLALAVAGGTICLSVPLAWLTVRTDLPLRRMWTMMTLLPLVIPSYVAGFIIISTLGPRGMLQQALEPLGLERLPDIYGFPGAFITLTLFSYPYVMLTVRAALLGMDPALEETSRSLGNAPWSTFRRVTLPQLRPSLAAGGILVALYALSDFGAVSLLRYETFTWAIYLQYQSSFDRTLAASLCLMLAGLAVVLLMIESLARGHQKRYYRSTAGAIRPLPKLRLGRWRWPSLVFCALVTTFSLIIPIGILIYWLATGLQAGEPLRFLWNATFNSVAVSSATAVLAIIAALPISILVVRYPRRISFLLERITYTGFALPGIVVALALVFFSANFFVSVYQTLALLIFAYLVLFLPAAIGSARTSLMQIRPSLEEAARSLGRTSSQTFITVTLRMMRPGIFAGAILVYILTMKELAATLILGSLGFKTLATLTWTAASEAFFARAAVPALLLILASLIPMTYLLSRERGLYR